MDATEPALETGWAATTPAGDTFVRRFVLNWAATVASVAAALGGRVLEGDDVAASDLGRPSGFFNCATLLRPLTAETRAGVMTALDAFYRLSEGGASGEVLLFSAWPTPDLRPDGWESMGHPPLRLLPAGAALPPVPPELRIERVRDGAGLRGFEQVCIDGYPLPDLQPFVPGTLLDERALNDERFRLWVGWRDEQPVSAAAAFVASGINNVGFVATLPEGRRRGYGEALTWRAALAEPGLPAMLLSSDPGRPVYERMGFLPLLRFTLWYRERPAR